MTLKFQICIILGIIILLAIILNLIKRKKLNLKYSLLWIATVVVMLIVAIFPMLAEYLASFLGIYSVTNAVFVIAGLFALLIILSLTSIVSRQTERIRNLTQEQAILEKRVRDLEDRLEPDHRNENKAVDSEE